MDIRSFFGGGGKPSKPLSAENGTKRSPDKAKGSPTKRAPANPKTGGHSAKPPSTVAPSAKEVHDLIDSDDEGAESVPKSQKVLRVKPRKDEAPAPVVENLTNQGSLSVFPSEAKPTEAKPCVSLKDVLPVLSMSSSRPSASANSSESASISASVPAQAAISTAASFFGEPEVAEPPPKKSKASPPIPRPSTPEPVSMSVDVPDGQPLGADPLTGFPLGRHLCLEGTKFVFTGEMDGIPRDVAEDLVKTLGGSVVSAVSGRVTHVVFGTKLENDKEVHTSKKYTTAQEKDIPLLDEAAFRHLIATRSRPVGKDAKKATASAAKKKSDWDPSIAVRANSSPAKKSPVRAAAPSSSSSSSSTTVKLSKPLALAAPVAKAAPLSSEMMWVDKYKPSSMQDMIGSASVVKQLTQWLDSWYDIHITGKKKKPVVKGQYAANPGAKAVLLSGPPGIGKTTMATLCAKEKGYELVEMNASDVRNRAAINDQVSGVVMSKAIAPDGSIRRRLLVMDEVDGMGAGDVGGMGAMVAIIKKSKNPIICICNDRSAQKMKPMVAACYDLKVSRPMKQLVAKRLKLLASNEGLNIEDNAAEALVEQSGGDIRQAIHALQMWRARSATMSYAELKSRDDAIGKDKMLRHSPFDACGMILGGSAKQMALSDRYNSFFIDYSLVPLLIQQNYLEAGGNGAFAFSRQPDEVLRLEALADAAAAVSDMDMAGSKIMGGGDQHWELLPAQAAMACRVGTKVAGYLPRPQFPGWMGKNSTRNKRVRLTKEIVHHTLLSIGQGFLPIRLEYVPFLREQLLQPLLRGGAEGATSVVTLLDAYGLSREDFIESMKELQFVSRDGGQAETALKDRFGAIESGTKAALTRAYNTSGHNSQALVHEQGAGKGSKKRAAASSAMADEEDDDEDDNEGDEADNKGGTSKDAEDVGDIAAFAKKQRKGKRSAPAKKKAPAKKAKVAK